MGKKRVASKSGAAGEGTSQGGSRLSRKKLDRGLLFVEATYNNTKVSLADPEGQIISWSSSGTLGFKGAKKGTPFAAAKVGEHMGDVGKQLAVRDIGIVVKGVGSGRESAIRAFVAKSGAGIAFIEDRTPVPFNGPKPKKARRV
jgi:small subunit ribosomal protein S11